MVFNHTFIAGMLIFCAGLSIAVLHVNNRHNQTLTQVQTPIIGGSHHRNGPWPECISMNKDKCVGLIHDLVGDDFALQVIPDGSPVTMDFRTDRVRIFYSEDDDTVVRAPHLG